MSLNTHRTARLLGLMGKEVTLTLTKVRRFCETVCSKGYFVQLFAKSGNDWKVRACGTEEVTASISGITKENRKTFKDQQGRWTC